MGNQGIALMPRIELPIGEGRLFRVYLSITASAVKKFRGKREYELRNRFYHKILHVGDMNREKMMAKKAPTKKITKKPADDDFQLADEDTTEVLDHPHADFAYVSQKVGFKLPDVLPQDYAMCEVTLEVGYITRRDNIAEESRQLLNTVGPTVMGQLDELARLCGGIPMFTPEEEAEAQAKADA